MKTIWEEVKDALKSELPKNTFSLWINPIGFLEKKEDTLVLGCPNRFSRDWVTENYMDMIRTTFSKVCDHKLDLEFKIVPPQAQYFDPDDRDSDQLSLPNIPNVRNKGHLCLNKDFTFDRFIVGRSNEFAYSASNELAYGQPCHYHTLLMLATTGLGKSHLTHAIGHAILEQHPESRVYYITAEDFTNQMISSLKNGHIEDFKNKYRRSCDVLLLEEIHFLSGKEKIQVELGYTLDALENDNKKILYTSSLPPKDIPKLSTKLSSRLTSGLVTTISTPDYDTRVKILTRKAQEHNISPREEIIHFLASRLTLDIRQMESALKCLKAKSELLNMDIDLDLAKEVVSCLVTDEDSVRSEDIIKLVSKYYKVDPAMLKSKSRKKIFTYPRNIYVYLCRQHTKETLENIARTINRNHTTALYASEVIARNIKTDSQMRRQINFLSEQIENMKK
ncbi:MAG: chromosomal replication initiator protein DnaA [Desulfatiglans sp.]|jgi:chromosomal replication initiator protein|nr:chromosomal replication initiator protein DnaA [Thermodesulfobacteriota bacterium]MEE4353879.1 chromosomal replication initiator protein DnaA [Desulfatiglans sp.]